MTGLKVRSKIGVDPIEERLSPYLRQQSGWVNGLFDLRHQTSVPVIRRLLILACLDEKRLWPHPTLMEIENLDDVLELPRPIFGTTAAVAI